ncbi:LpqB family beta-propeller domain-containing protein [Nonomuraea sp. NPDC049695]|uniref:LpqB family beta-propeller domain-containing protein n=1 Tax=Nonomuraea sp. NPDC049695 TaxID=3154734 RepID=UPI0034447D05
MTRTRRPASVTRAWRLASAVAIVAAMALAGSGCTVIPVTGPLNVNETGSNDPLSKPFQRMIAIPPQRTWGLEQTLRGLQAAMAAYADDPTVLPQYLTPEARAKWNASGPVTVLEDDFEVVPPAAREEPGAAQKVTLKGRWVARINEDDSYVPTGGPWEAPFELVQVQGGGYRVKSLPNELLHGLLLTHADVARAYRATNLYYLNGNTRDRLVVDRVRLRLKPTETYAHAILQRLLKNPTGALQGAVTTSFPPGTKILSIRSDERVVINLSGPIDTLDPSTEALLKAQIRYSLNKNEIAKGRVIEIQVDGEPYSVDPPNSDDQWLDDSSDTAYYVTKGAVHYMGKDGPSVAVPGPAGEPREGYSGYALSKDGTQIAAKTSTGISVAGLTAQGHWQEVIQGAKLTLPTWHRDGSLWTYDQENAVLLRYDPSSGKGPQRVAAPKLTGLDVTRLRIARDGVRVAVMTGENTVQIGALTGEAAGPMLGNFQLLTTTTAGNKILDVAWSDDEHLLVLVGSKAGQTLNEINVGDGEVAGVPLNDVNDPVTSLAAMDDRVLAEADAGPSTKIYELNQDRQSWTVKIESDAGSPLFPLG